MVKRHDGEYDEEDEGYYGAGWGGRGGGRGGSASGWGRGGVSVRGRKRENGLSVWVEK